MDRPGLPLLLLSVYNTLSQSSQAALVPSSNHTTSVIEEKEVLIKEKSEPQKLLPSRFLDGFEFPDLCANSGPESSLCDHTCTYIRVKIPVVAKLICLLSIFLPSLGPAIGLAPLPEVAPQVCPVGSST